MATLLSAIETKVRFRLQESAALASPGSITVTNQGTPGTKIYTYKLVAINATGTTEAGAASTTTTGATTLTGVNFNRLSWTAVTGATGYWIYRVASTGTPSTTGRIAVLGAITTLDDTGLAGDSSTAPTSNTSGLTNPFWSSDELIGIEVDAIHDLWRDVADLKQEHYLTLDTTNVTLPAASSTMSGVPSDVHKVYIIEPRDMSENGSNHGLVFQPLEYNDHSFQAARASAAVDPSLNTIYYAVHQQGGPVGAPTILIAPQVTSAVNITLGYVPTLGTLTAASTVPIPGEADNAIIAWTVAFARAKERDDHSPDPAWLAIYAAEKQHLLQSLGLRQYQEPSYVQAVWSEYWS